jgi:hypothetical protein
MMMMMMMIMMTIIIIIIIIIRILNISESKDRFICSRQEPVAGCCGRRTGTFAFHKRQEAF